MRLEPLSVLHISKCKSGVSSVPKVEGAFFLETCQRWIWIFSSKLKACTQILQNRDTAELFQGQEAYAFLLKLAAGLESRVLGETDVFGQMKEAWRKAQGTGDAEISALEGWMQKIFEDTKEIRTRYLKNSGGSSYGSLIRKVIKEQKFNSEGPIFLVGAGQAARSIAPFLLDTELWIWNRSDENLSKLYQNLIQRRGARVKKLDLHEEKKGWIETQSIVVCTPLDQKRDMSRLAWFLKGNAENRVLIHLGGVRAQCQSWDLPKCSFGRIYFLDDLFDLQEALGHSRSLQMGLASKACEERAKLRNLDMSLSISHCWEDLACFV